MADVLPGPGVARPRTVADDEAIIVDHEPAPILILPVTPVVERDRAALGLSIQDQTSPLRRVYVRRPSPLTSAPGPRTGGGPNRMQLGPRPSTRRSARSWSAQGPSSRRARRAPRTIPTRSTRTTRVLMTDDGALLLRPGKDGTPRRTRRRRGGPHRARDRDRRAGWRLRRPQRVEISSGWILRRSWPGAATGPTMTGSRSYAHRWVPRST